MQNTHLLGMFLIYFRTEFQMNADCGSLIVAVEMEC